MRQITDLPPVFHSNEDALKWVISLVERAEEARAYCDITLPDRTGITIADQRKAERTFLMHHGSAIGALAAMLRCDKISASTYNELVERVRKTLLPSNVGLVSR